MKKPAPKPRQRSAHVTTTYYDPDAKTLDVTFRNGRVYRYSDVPEHHGNAILNAESRGSYLHQNIIGNFAHKEITS